MTQLNISLPDDLQEFIEQQIAVRGYNTASDYIGYLIRQEQQRAEQQLEALLIEGLDSGNPIEANETWWTQKRSDLIEGIHSSPS